MFPRIAILKILGNSRENNHGGSHYLIDLQYKDLQLDEKWTLSGFFSDEFSKTSEQLFL